MLFQIPLNYDYFRSLILPLKEIDHFIPNQGNIIDLGCGEGVIAKYLARNKKRIVIGVDKDRSRLPNIKNSNLLFQYGDITKIDIKDSNGIVISDVLHHLETSNQKKLITKLAKKLKKGGILIIKEIDTKEFVRSKLSRFWDLLLYPQDKIFYWDSSDLKNFLISLGFKVKLVRSLRLFPGSTTLFICKK